MNPWCHCGQLQWCQYGARRGAGSGRCGAPAHWPAIPSPAPARPSSGSDGLDQTPRCQKTSTGIAKPSTSSSPLDLRLRQRFRALRPGQPSAPVALLPAEAPRNAIASFVNATGRRSRWEWRPAPAGRTRAGRGQASREPARQIVAADGGVILRTRRCLGYQENRGMGRANSPKAVAHLSSDARRLSVRQRSLRCLPFSAAVLCAGAGRCDQQRGRLCQRTIGAGSRFVSDGSPPGRGSILLWLTARCAPPVRWHGPGPD